MYILPCLVHETHQSNDCCGETDRDVRLRYDQRHQPLSQFSNNKHMKRRRPCLNIFSASDSDESKTPTPTGTGHDLASSPSSKFSSHSIHQSSPQPDTLDTFMNTISSSTNTSSVGLPKVAEYKDSSDEEPRVEPSTIQTSKPLDASGKLPHVNRLKFKPPPHLESDISAVLQHTKSLRATVRNGTLPIISSFQDTSPPAPQKLVVLLSSFFPSPTSIQALSLPYTLSGRDIVAIAQTGSGKTIAYTLPLLTHVSAQKGSSRSGNGPVGLVIVPTRDLAIQVSDVINEYGATISVSSLCVVGGVPKYEQFKQIRDSGASVIVCTPGRLIDMLRMGACRLKRCSFIVIDEADRMLDLGFEPQVRSILSQIRPDAQRALFSATMPKFVERLTADVLNDPVHISFTGSTNQNTAMVTENVNDCFFYFDEESARNEWLVGQLSTFVNEGLLIIFCSTRGESAALANDIRGKGMPAACIHGETDQSDREDLLRMFRRNELPVLVTTDIAARGLDIENVQNVVNYGCAKSWEWHVHRVGRSGRATQKGNAYTLMISSSQNDLVFANNATSILNRERRDVAPALLHLQRLHRNGLKKGSQGRRKFRRQKIDGG